MAIIMANMTHNKKYVGMFSFIIHPCYAKFIYFIAPKPKYLRDSLAPAFLAVIISRNYNLIKIQGFLSASFALKPHCTSPLLQKRKK